MAQLLREAGKLLLSFGTGHIKHTMIPISIVFVESILRLGSKAKLTQQQIGLGTIQPCITVLSLPLPCGLIAMQMKAICHLVEESFSLMEEDSVGIKLVLSVGMMYVVDFTLCNLPHWH